MDSTSTAPPAAKAENHNKPAELLTPKIHYHQILSSRTGPEVLLIKKKRTSIKIIFIWSTAQQCGRGQQNGWLLWKLHLLWWTDTSQKINGCYGDTEICFKVLKSFFHHFSASGRFSQTADPQQTVDSASIPEETNFPTTEPQRPRRADASVWRMSLTTAGVTWQLCGKVVSSR